MTTRILCDWCVGKDWPRNASFRVELKRLLGESYGDSTCVDESFDICKQHYKELWQFHCNMGDIVQA